MTTLTNTTSNDVTTAKQTNKDNSAFAMLGDWLAQGARVYRNAPISLTLTSLVLRSSADSYKDCRRLTACLPLNGYRPA